jgi:hypothetical protein
LLPQGKGYHANNCAFISLLALLTKHNIIYIKYLVHSTYPPYINISVELLATITGEREAWHGTGPTTGQEILIMLYCNAYEYQIRLINKQLNMQVPPVSSQVHSV